MDWFSLGRVEDFGDELYQFNLSNKKADLYYDLAIDELIKIQSLDLDKNIFGYFDEKYFAYQEDSDYCLRAIKSGWKVYYNPKAVVIHKGGSGGSNSVPYKSTFEWLIINKIVRICYG